MKQNGTGLQSLIFLTFIQVSLSVQSFAQEIRPDSLQPYPWIKGELNYVQFYNKSDLQSFYEKWKGEGRISIAHFGDSHVQPDIYPGEMRKRLQAVRGKGGHGMTFPYSTARTYSTFQYHSTHTGTWTFAKSIEFKPKLPLGPSGATSRTFDSNASFKLVFKSRLPETYRKLRIFCSQNKNSYDFFIQTGGHEIFVDVDSINSRPIEIELPALDNSIRIRLVKSNTSQTEFEFYGLSIESVTPGGLVLHCLGIGGSRYGSLLEEVLLADQLPALQPDLIILDFGTNDYLYDNRIAPNLEGQIVQVITKVRRIAPGATVLLTTTQDMKRKRVNVTAGELFSDLIRKVAKEQRCPFYDWYWISGGPEKMNRWQQSGLAQGDMIHLTMKGYTLKGQMLAEALTNSLALFSNGKTPDALVFDVDSLKLIRHLIPDSAIKLAKVARSVEKIPAPKNVTGKEVIIRHKIKKGETLSSIARDYQVKVADIKLTNGIEDSRIIEGKFLNIMLIQSQEKKPAVVAVKKQPIEPKGNYLLHKIEKGDTLSELAEKYKVTVAQLKSLNGLRTSRIKAGNSLKIKLKSEPTSGL